MDQKQSNIVLALSYTITALLIVFSVFRIINGVNIRSLLSQNMNAFNNSMIVEYSGTTYTKRFHVQKYVDQLRAINASSSPQKFQRAWSEYVQVWEKEEKMEERSNKGPIIDASPSDSSQAHSIGFDALLLKARKDISQVSSEYGVRIQQADQ